MSVFFEKCEKCDEMAPKLRQIESERDALRDALARSEALHVEATNETLAVRRELVRAERERDEARARASSLRAALEPFAETWRKVPAWMREARENRRLVEQLTVEGQSLLLNKADAFMLAEAALAATTAESLEAIRTEAKREAQREMQSSTFGDLVKGCETLSHRIESHEWDNMPVWAQRDWLLQQAEVLHQQWCEKWRHTLDRESDNKQELLNQVAEAGRERAVRELLALCTHKREAGTGAWVVPEAVIMQRATEIKQEGK